MRNHGIAQTTRHKGRVKVSYSLLAEVLGLPPQATITATRDNDIWLALEVLVEGDDRLPLVAPGEEVPEVSLEHTRVESRFVVLRAKSAS